MEEKKPKSDKKRKEDLLKEACDRYKVAETFWADNRKRQLEDIKFRAGDQWPETIKAKRKKKGRPTLVCDKINQYIRQVVNDGRQNRPSLKFRPVEGGDVKTADAFQGITRSILNRSNADEAFDTSLDHSAGHGTGYIRLVTDYVHPGSFLQDIKVMRVRNSLSVLLSPHQAADGSDAEYGFVIDLVPKSVFKAKYPKAEFTNWKGASEFYADGWIDEEHVRVCEYFHKVMVEKVILLLEDGQVVEESSYKKSIAEGKQLPAEVNRRFQKDYEVRWCRMTGAEILEEGKHPGVYIPIIPVYGTEEDVNGKVSYKGLTRPARDGQMLYNFARSAFAERVALTPKAPYVAAVGQVEDIPEWKTAHEDNHPVLTYNPVDINGTVVPPPQRQSATDIPAGWSQEMQHSEHDIQSSIGMYAASLGEKSNEKSGRAIIARDRQSDVGTFHYHDNLNRAIRFLGKQLLDLIPKVYDTKRIVRLLGEDGKTSDVEVDPKFPAPSGKRGGLEVFNLNAGVYDVETATGPSFTTKRLEAAEAMMEMTRANPQYLQTHGDIIVKSQDWPGAEEFAKRTRALMPPEMLKAIEAAENEGGEDPKVEQIIRAAEQEIQQRDAALEEAKMVIAEAQRKLDAKDEELDIKKKAAAVDEYEAETKRLEMVLPFLTPEQLVMITARTTGQSATPDDLMTAWEFRNRPPEPMMPETGQPPIPMGQGEAQQPAPMPEPALAPAQEGMDELSAEELAQLEALSVNQDLGPQM